jgi:protein-disulfide isomerase
MTDKKVSKRQILRDKRRKEQRRQQYIILITAGVVILILAGILIYPQVKPIGEITVPTFLTRPNINGLSMGDPNAPVKVEEFADFQCPACKNFTDSLEPGIISSYVATGKVFYTFYPFSFIGKESFAAAEAGYCASDQGKFWEYHDILFANQTGENIGDFTDRRLRAFAEKIGMDLAKYDTCYKKGTYQQKVLDDVTYGDKFTVTQTPSFVVNGELILPDKLIETIDKALAAK